MPETRLHVRKSLLAALLGAASLAAVAAEPPVPLRMRLQGPALQMDVSPRLGGRILHLSLPGAPNLLLEGPAVQAEPDPQVRADGDNIPYLGHEVWVGPQSEWWTHQALNPARRKAGAIWPPDPWLAHAPAKVLEQGDARLVVEGAASPVSGVQLTQSFNLAHDRAELVVDMRNIRKEPVARDI